jgi:cobalamin biosynthesis protein CobD/CbiB
MNSPTENASPQDRADKPPLQSHPTHWSEALITLLASRVSLMQIEARETARRGARRMAGVIAAVICLFFTWALLLAGGIALVSSMAGWPWHWLAIAAAGLHFSAALLLLKRGSVQATEPAFPLTRAEFQKDREWIENLQKKPKSNA